MAGSVEVWLSTALSVSILILVAVLMMAKWWPSKAASAAATAACVGREKSEEERLEMQVKELEMEGDLDGAAALLLSAWTSKGSTRAVTLAHELSRRYPDQASQIGCPLQQGSRLPDVSPTREQGEERHDEPGDAVGDSTITSAASPSEAVAPYADGSAAPESFSDEDDERRLPPVAPTPEIKRSTSSGQRDVTAAVTLEKGSPGSGDRDGDGRDEWDGDGSDGETPPTPTPTRTPAATTSTNSALTTPWERGWQGPEGFEPPPSPSPSPSSSSSDVVSGTVTNPTRSVGVGVGVRSTSSSMQSSMPSQKGEEAEEGDLGGEQQAVVLRNFTVSQLNAFDGGVPTPIARGGVIKARDARPIYIALRGVVYDASAGRHLYGPGGDYSEFAGHDVSRRVARGLKDATGAGAESAPMDDLSLEGLDRFEEMTLRGWEDTFKARGYPRVGRVVTPPPPRLFSRAELRAFDGRSAVKATCEEATGGGRGKRGQEPWIDAEGNGGTGAEGEAGPESGPAPMTMPAGYAVRPIYMGVRDKVFDVSFGGSEFYVDGGPYECLAGRDASRVLAKMSMKPEDVEGVLDYASLNSREEKNLADWVEKLGERGRGYPVVGWILLDSA